MNIVTFTEYVSLLCFMYLNSSLVQVVQTFQSGGFLAYLIYHMSLIII